MSHDRQAAILARSDRARHGAGALNEYAPLRRVALRHARDAFRDPKTIARDWRGLGYPAAPDYAAAVAEYERFAETLHAAGAEIAFLPAAEALSLDSLYVRDAAVLTPAGVVLGAMGKPARTAEPAALGRALADLGLPLAGRIAGAGRLEGGDLLWLDATTCALGLGYRSNAEGLRQLAAILGPGVEAVGVPLPHHKGPDDVFHLMSIVSPLDADLALVHSPLMPVPFRELLLERGLELVEVAEDEFETLGCNALALAPRRCLMAAGNPATRGRLEAAGCEVLTYDGAEISLKGAGGPTCLTRPLLRG